MSRTFRRSRSAVVSVRPMVAFLLIACFGILFAGCASQPQEPEDVVFTQDELERARELAQQVSSSSAGSGITVPALAMGTGTGLPSVDLSQVPTFNAIRTAGSLKQSQYRVSFDFVNIRSEPRVTGSTLGRKERGELFDVVEFVDSSWAKVRLDGDAMGYVSAQYLARVVPEEKLAEEKKQFEGMYFVDFQFLNVRAQPDQKSEKLGELQSQSIVRPLAIENGWARVPFNGRDGYVSSEYLEPFLPTILVRQERFELPMLMYNVADADVLDALVRHTARLREEKMKVMTLREVADTLQKQEQRDVRLDPKSVVVGVTGLTPENAASVTTALQRNGIHATVFLQTKDIGITGITEKQLLTLIAGGQDVESAGHTGDDLRSLTDAQVQLELVQSRKIIEDVTKRPVLAMLYPMGGTNDRVMQMAADAGYLFGITSMQDRVFTRDQLLRLPSMTIAPLQTGDDLMKLVRGS